MAFYLVKSDVRHLRGKWVLCFSFFPSCFTSFIKLIQMELNRFHFALSLSLSLLQSFLAFVINNSDFHLVSDELFCIQCCSVNVSIALYLYVCVCVCMCGLAFFHKYLKMLKFILFFLLQCKICRIIIKINW